jgi:SAM-dependent methyltransferase
MIDGFIDYCDRFTISGWAADQDSSEPPLLVVAIDGAAVGEFKPTIERPGLGELNIRNGKGFLYSFRQPLSRDALIEVKTPSGQQLGQSPWTYTHDPLPPLLGDPTLVRLSVARQFLSGEGLEVGALANALSTPVGAKVRYVDRVDLEALRRHYPGLSEHDIVKPDILDDGERLGTIGSSTQDFVVANHFIEHAEDPIQCLKTFARVLKVGGVLYLAVPDKEKTFDKDRLPTSIQHLREDHLHGPARSRSAHFVEFVQFVNKESGGDVYARAAALDATSYSIHFHVWTKTGFLEFLGHVCREYQLPFDVLLCVANDNELICVLRKT